MIIDLLTLCAFALYITFTGLTHIRGYRKC